MYYSPLCDQYSNYLRLVNNYQDSIKYSTNSLDSCKKILGDNHIQIAKILLGRSCSYLELKDSNNCQLDAKKSLKIIEFNLNNNLSDSNLLKLKSSCLFLIGQSMMLDKDIESAKNIFTLCLYITKKLNDHSKYLAIKDQLNFIQSLE